MKSVVMKIAVVSGIALLGANVVVRAAMPEDFSAIALRLHEHIMEAVERESAEGREQEAHAQQYEQLSLARQGDEVGITCWSNESYQRLVAQLEQIVAARDVAEREKAHVTVARDQVAIEKTQVTQERDLLTRERNDLRDLLAAARNAHSNLTRTTQAQQVHLAQMIGERDQAVREKDQAVREKAQIAQERDQAQRELQAKKELEEAEIKRRHANDQAVREQKEQDALRKREKDQLRSSRKYK